MDGSWNLLSETIIKEDSKLRKHANELLTPYESAPHYKGTQARHKILFQDLNFSGQKIPRGSLLILGEYKEPSRISNPNGRTRGRSKLQKTRNFQIWCTAPAPVTNKLKDSPIIYEEKHLFTEQSLKKKQTLSLRSILNNLSPPTALNEITEFWTKTPYSQHQNIRSSSMGASPPPI